MLYSPKQPYRSIFLIFLLYLPLVFWLYRYSLQSWWCCDDPQILKHALQYSPLEYFTVPNAWRALIPYSLTPWLSLTYDLDYMFFGLDPKGYYLHNLLVILLCACLIHQIARQWVNNGYAFGASAIFLAGSPIMAASQQLMVRHYLEGMFFYLCALLLIILRLNQEKEARPVWLAGISFAIAATAKEIYLPLGLVPFLLPLGTLRQRIRTAWPLLLVMLLYLPWRWYMLGDLIGGYTPATELGSSDLLSALRQFAGIPGLLLTQPWSALLLLLPVLTLLIRKRGELQASLLLVILPVLLLAPLVPLARQPGIGAGSDRYFIALWATFALVGAIVSGTAVAGRGPFFHLSAAAILTTLTISARTNALEVGKTLFPSLQEQSVQGKALVTADSSTVIWLTPPLAVWYVSGITDLYRKDHPPIVASDESDLDSLSANRHVLRYDTVSRKMNDISPEVTQILGDWRKKIRPTPLLVDMKFDPATKTIHWQLGPYQTGTYTMLPGGGRQILPFKGALRMEKPPEGSYRFRYDSPEGWIAYTPLLGFKKSGQGSYRCFWSGTGLPFAESGSGNRQ